MNSLRGIEVEKIVAGKYNGTLPCDHVRYDIELEESLLEVKSCLDWHFYSRGLRRYPGRFLINKEYHKNFKKIADEKNKRAIYVFVKIPRYDSGAIEEDPKEFQEAWMKWEHVEKLVNDPNKVGIVKSRLRDDFVRYYYAVRLEHIFGNNH